ncbi:MAG: AzlD domain-containing protein [Spirochaetaceae bacterium]|nr:AzlD domain-containing protein [Spirochaetaceae bacterium]
MTPVSQGIFQVFVMAAIIFFTRAFPFIVFSRRKPGGLLQLVAEILPPMVMAILVIYSLKVITFSSPQKWLPEILATALTVFLHLWKRNSMISIFGGTIFYMILLNYLNV